MIMTETYSYLDGECKYYISDYSGHTWSSRVWGNESVNFFLFKKKNLLAFTCKKKKCKNPFCYFNFWISFMMEILELLEETN